MTTEAIKSADDATSAAAVHSEDENQFVIDAGTSKYRDIPAAVKGIKDKDAYIEQMKAAQKQKDDELAALRAQIAQGQQLGKLVGVQEEAAQRQRQAELEEQRAKLRDAIAADPGQMVDHVSAAISQMDRDYERKLEEARKKDREDFQKQLDELRNGVSATVQDLNPDFVSRRERVLEYQEKYGVTREQALKIDKDLHPTLEFERDTPPGHVSARGSAPRRPTGPLVSAEEKAQLISMDAEYWSKPENIAKLEASRRAKLESQKG